MGVQLTIHECRLHKCLTVVEHAVYLNGSDVLSQCGELLLLNQADLAFGIEHVDLYAVNAKEPVGNRTPCVTARGHKHVDLLFAFFANEVSQQACHEACTHILECKGRTVEQLQRPDVAIADMHKRNVEAHGVADYLPQCVFLNIFAEEGFCHADCNLLQRHVLYIVEELLRQLLYLVWHEQTTVCGKSLDDSLFECDIGCVVVGTVIHHIFRSSCFSFILSA